MASRPQQDFRVRSDVEAILNDRPITKMSDDPMDLEALTPNHLLLLKLKPILLPGLFVNEDLYVKQMETCAIHGGPVLETLDTGILASNPRTTTMVKGKNKFCSR